MARLLSQLALFSVVLPATTAAYHFAVGRAAPGLAAGGGGLASVVGSFSLGDGYDLGELELLERNLYYVEQRYVEKDRLRPDRMFSGALDQVEKDFAEVLFEREAGGRRLSVAVGAWSTTLTLETIDSFAALYDALRRVAQLLDEHLSSDVDRADVEYALLNGALTTLDPHSHLLPPREAREMEVDNDGEFGGLGLEINTEDGRLVVRQPMDGGPAARAGVRAGDRILRIDDESTLNMEIDEAVERLRGDIGSTVRLLVQRGAAAPQVIPVTREIIRLNPVEGVLLDGDVAYVRVRSFNRLVGAQMEEQLGALRREAGGAPRGLVLDLRGNPGGYLNQAFELCDKFLSEGVIVTTVEGAGRRREEQRATRSGTEPAYPMVVLVDAHSASASEIVAGALRNRDRAVIIGERSYGKGSVQHLYTNKDDSVLKLTVAQYLTPGDHSIQSVGIPPDIRLLPTVVRAPTPPRAEPLVGLFWRDQVDREADLERHLDNAQARPATPPAWSVRYLHDAEDLVGQNPRTDWQVDFARRVVLAAPSARRAEVLAAAEGVVQAVQAREWSAIGKAFGKLGVDWSDGPSAPGSFRVSADLGPDGVLRAGQREAIRFTVTNTGAAAQHRVTAVLGSENPWLDETEFAVGRLGPGESRTLTHTVQLPEGYPEEEVPFTLHLRGADGAPIGDGGGVVASRGRPLPSFAWSVRLLDDGSGNSRGNGDGKPDAGEVLDLEIEVVNTGAGATAAAFARLRNRSGALVDLESGRVPLGSLRRADGAACAKEGDGCQPRMQPGERHVGRFTFTVRGPPPAEGWQLGIEVGDMDAYDYAAVQQAGFHSTFRLEEALVLQPGAALPGGERRPPSIDVTRHEAPRAPGDVALTSGMVRDDESVRDLLIYLDDDKVYYRGGGRSAAALPFSVEPAVEAGVHQLTVLARDHRGLTATWARRWTVVAPAVTAQAPPE
jgi:carboxyl-terminal processing protease